jgi:hypothetical protein
MMGPLTTFWHRATLAAGAVLALLGVAPAYAVQTTVYWDRADFGFGAGYGVSQTTAQTANAAGIQIISLPNLLTKPDSLVVENDLDENSLVLPSSSTKPATIRSDWTATNGTGITNQNLYLVYVRPVTNTIEVDGAQHTYTYDPDDVGLRLSSGEGGLDWVILQVPSNPVDPNSTPVYYPAVSLGILGNGAAADFALHYSLLNPQVFDGSTQDVLGLPKWTLAFYSTAAPIPEPSSGVLMLVGLLGIARARRKHS